MSNSLLVEVDLAGAEWTATAFITGDARMMSVVQEKKDPHLITGHLISKAPFDLILKEHDILGVMTDAVEIENLRRRLLPDLFDHNLVKFLPRTMSIRQCGKRSNHALNYLMGPNTFAEWAELDIPDAKIISHMYSSEAYQGLNTWWSAVERQLKENRTVVNCFGRKRRFLGPWGHDILKEAVAFIPQSTVSDVVTWGMAQLFRDRDLMSRVDLLANVHDSLLFQTKVHSWNQTAKDICDIALRYMSRPCHYGGRDFVIDTDVKVGLNWGTMTKLKISKDLDHVASELRKAYEKLTAAAGAKAA